MINNQIKAAIFLAHGYEMGEAIIIIDILRRAKIAIDLVAVENNLLVRSSHNVEIKCEKLLTAINFDHYQILILPGGSVGVSNLNKNQLLKNQLVAFANTNKLIAAICAAPQILGQLNLLDGKTVSFYPGCDEGLAKAIKTTDPVSVSGNIITGKSIGCAFAFALRIVEILVDQTTANQVKQALVF